MTTRAALFATLIALVTAGQSRGADDASSPLPSLKVPDGFSIELAAGPPLVERPIVAAFDDDGRLYVAESSGSNDPVEKQLAERPHRIVRLDDTDGDGKFDRRTVFADHMMFPEGALFFDGSLFVSAPPSIWKLTDKDNDGVADERVEWFQGKTLTGCANDLHGPYAGPDGWIYWCKGAFAEQTYTINGHEWKTRAAHIFRCRPDGTGLEPVLTGGMDNPVDIVFMPDGERILSATFIVGNGRQDGLLHAIYGGVYGKDHGVLAGHPRTGELMPAFDLMDAATPCGLERYDSDVFGADYRDNLFLCQFNLRKVSRHVLRPSGSSYTSEDSDFVSSDFVDFHPTDVVVDADGTLLVIDTGGWYKLCCPTSQLWKPDVLGGIYRVRRVGAKAPDDPRGGRIDWSHQTLEQLWSLLADNRSAVRQRASREFVRRNGSNEMQSILANMAARGNSAEKVKVLGSAHAAMSRGWALSQIESTFSRFAVRGLLFSDDEHVRHAALQSISLHRDSDAVETLFNVVLIHDTAANRRLAAEALGRIGNPAAVPKLLAAAAKADDRILQHSIIYALIELADPTATTVGLTSHSPRTVSAALIALDQMPDGGLGSQDVIPFLNSADASLRNAARWVVAQHADWGGALAQWLREQFHSVAAQSTGVAEQSADANLEAMFVSFSSDAAIQQLLADVLTQRDSSAAARAMTLRVMSQAKLEKPPAAWTAVLTKTIHDANAELLPLAIAAASKSVEPLDQELVRSLLAVAESSKYPNELRVAALAVVTAQIDALSEPQFQLLIGALSAEDAVTLRVAAADAVSKSHLSAAQLDRLCDAARSAGPLELNRLLAPFERSTDEQLGLKLLSSLKQASALPALRIDLVRQALAKYSPEVQKGVDEFESLVNVDAAAQRKRIEEFLPLVAQGDVRRGHAVFHSSKAACSVCHRLGYAGGTTGPELSHIGNIRTERDLVESILYPSLSFVRSYESVLIITQDGKTINGTIRNETADEYTLATGPDQEARVRRGDIEQIGPSTVSIMPAGLDKQLTPQELADLVAFLKNTADH